MPTNAGASPALDIIVQGPVGSAAAPVQVAPPGPTVTVAPPGWVGGDGQFFEWRGRPIRIPILAGNTGFVPRLRLGWKTAVYCADPGDGEGCFAIPCVLYSQSLIGTLNPPFNVAQIADPSYGPVIRLTNSGDVQGGIFVVHLNIYAAQDEDRAETGF
jgi:hypothetical protein